MGLERSDAAIAIAGELGVPTIKVDLEGEIVLDQRADVVISTEVAEHLPDTAADGYVKLLCSLSDIVVLTAAPPGQGGTGHVNEQPPEYWLEKFASHAYARDDAETQKMRAEWREGGTADFYHLNVMVFRRV